MTLQHTEANDPQPTAEEIEATLGPVRVRHRLAELAHTPLNFDTSLVADPRPGPEWQLEDVRHPLPYEEPGPPQEDGVFQLAKRLIRGYEFADPSIVRAYYDLRHPLLGRNMVLRLRALGVVQLLVGVRVLDVIDERRSIDGRQAWVWGWRYGTLEGHVEMGEMSWEVWKWADTGEITFRIHAVSREAHIANPIIRVGFRLVGPHERRVFLSSTGRRMRRFTELAAKSGPGSARPLVAEASAELTARPMRDESPHRQVGRNLQMTDEPG